MIANKQYNHTRRQIKYQKFTKWDPNPCFSEFTICNLSTSQVVWRCLEHKSIFGTLLCLPVILQTIRRDAWSTGRHWSSVLFACIIINLSKSHKHTITKTQICSRYITIVCFCFSFFSLIKPWVLLNNYAGFYTYLYF